MPAALTPVTGCLSTMAPMRMRTRRDVKRSCAPQCVMSDRRPVTGPLNHDLLNEDS